MATIEDMEEVVFGCCGAVAWLPKNLLLEKRKTCETFYCPNGHPRAFKESTADKLQRQLDSAKASLEDKDAKLRNIKVGKCPWCWKTVKDLSGHIQRNHQ